MAQWNPKNRKQWVVEPKLETGVYKYFLGGFYLVLGIAYYYEENKFMVVCIQLQAEKGGPPMEVIPLKDFCEDVPDPSPHKRDKLIPRFEFCGNYFRWMRPDGK